MFTTMYQERCIDFDEIFAWEGVQYTASDWWKNIPVEYQQKIKFYNHYIEEGDFDVARAMNFRVLREPPLLPEDVPTGGEERRLRGAKT